MTPAPDRRYWLVKSEPEAFSWDDLWRASGRATSWDGVRNYQARNFMRDGMRVGDQVLFYHSSTGQPAIVGIAEVAREAHPDPTAFDPAHPNHDPKSNPDAPAWLMVDLRAIRALPSPITLSRLRETPGLESMVLLRRGSRLSVQPVTPAEWTIIERLAGGASRATERKAR